MIPALRCKYVLPFIAAISMSLPGYARDEVPEMELEQIVCHDAKTCYEKGKVEFEQGQYERAQALFRRATVLAPTPRSKARMLVNMGTTCLLRGQAELASNYFTTYLEQDIEKIELEEKKSNIPLEQRVPSRPDINSLLIGIALYQEGFIFFSKGNFEQSAVMYTRAQEYFESHPELTLSTQVAASLHLPLGSAYDKAGKFGQAHREYLLYVDTAAVTIETPKVQERIRELEQLLAPQAPEKVLPIVPPIAVPPPVIVSPPEKSFLQRHKWSVITAGGTAALGLGAVVNHLSANAAYQDLRERCAGENNCSPSDADGIKSKDTLTALLSIASILGLGAAGTLFYFEMPKNVTSSVTSDGVQVEVRY